MADVFKPLNEQSKALRIGFEKLCCQNAQIITLLEELLVLLGGPTTTTTSTTTTTTTTP